MDDFKAFVDAGITTFDTGPEECGYGPSEALVGQFLRTGYGGAAVQARRLPVYELRACKSLNLSTPTLRRSACAGEQQALLRGRRAAQLLSEMGGGAWEGRTRSPPAPARARKKREEKRERKP